MAFEAEPLVLISVLLSRKQSKVGRNALSRAGNPQANRRMPHPGRFSAGLLKTKTGDEIADRFKIRLFLLGEEGGGASLLNSLDSPSRNVCAELALFPTPLPQPSQGCLLVSLRTGDSPPRPLGNSSWQLGKVVITENIGVASVLRTRSSVYSNPCSLLPNLKRSRANAHLAATPHGAGDACG